MTRLLIVESPNKVKHIEHHLGDGWQVAASAGHVRDLPQNEMGVAGPDYWPQYVNTERGGAVIARLRKLAQAASEVWLATDPDREGEAIAWHLAQVLGKEHVFKRVTFNEISKTAIHKAIAAPRQIDRRLFLAQQGRRVLDRLYGYKVSPALDNKLGQHGLSAGRVQSVALRLVVEREEAIRNFQKVKHFGVLLVFAAQEGNAPDNGQWSARWTPPLTVRPGTDAHPSPADDADNTPLITDRTIAAAVLAAARQGVVVTHFTEKTQARKPPPPFTTSTLQQAASVQLHLGVNATMQAAQALFEAGLITYHRTDNPNLSDDGIAAIWALLRQRGQDAYIPDKPNTWKAKDGAQEAHEAIRPTDFNLYKGADCAARGVDAVQTRLYQLIWRRAVASQMRAAQFKVRSATLATTRPVVALDAVAAPADGVPGQQQATFAARGQEMIFAGWMRLAQGGDETGEKKPEGDKEEEANGLLPLLTVGAHHTPQDGHILDLETKPPGRFSEAGLVKKLEAEGIGRPATYAAIIGTLTGKGYVETVKRFFVPSALGEAIVNGLRHRFDFLEVHYTREMEERLDAIAAGTADYRDVVAHYDHALDGQLAQFAQVELPRFAGTEESATYPCPDCGDGMLRRLKSKTGFFWGCSNYNRSDNPCKATFPDAGSKPGERPQQSHDHPCPECGKGYLQRRAGKKKGSYWWGCNAYPACNYTAPDEKGKPGVWSDRPASAKTSVKPATGKTSGKTATGGKTAGKTGGSTIARGGYRCPDCGGELVQRTGSKGVFWGCKNYPGCKHTEPDAHGEPRFAATE